MGFKLSDTLLPWEGGGREGAHTHTRTHTHTHTHTEPSGQMKTKEEEVEEEVGGGRMKKEERMKLHVSALNGAPCSLLVEHS